MVRCGAGAGLNIEGCGAVWAPALNDCAVRLGFGLLHCEAVRSRAKLLDPRRALVGWLFFLYVPHSIWVCRLTGGMNASVFICMDWFHVVLGVSFRQFPCSICSWLYCVSLCCCWGRGYWPVVGSGVLFSVLVVFPGDLPEWGHP